MTQVVGNSMYLNRRFTGIIAKIAKTFATGTEFALACLKCFVTAKKRETIVIRRRSPTHSEKVRRNRCAGTDRRPLREKRAKGKRSNREDSVSSQS
jgi:hypothetical protein